MTWMNIQNWTKPFFFSRHSSMREMREQQTVFTCCTRESEWRWSIVSGNMHGHNLWFDSKCRNFVWFGANFTISPKTNNYRHLMHTWLGSDFDLIGWISVISCHHLFDTVFLLQLATSRSTKSKHLPTDRTEVYMIGIVFLALHLC